MEVATLTTMQIAFSTFLAVVIWTGTNNIVTGLIVGAVSIAISYGNYNNVSIKRKY